MMSVCCIAFELMLVRVVFAVVVVCLPMLSVVALLLHCLFDFMLIWVCCAFALLALCVWFDVALLCCLFWLWYCLWYVIMT